VAAALKGMGTMGGRFARALAGAAVLAVLSGVAGRAATADAPPPSALVSALAGGWELADGKSGRKCRLTLSDTPVANGYGLGAPPACRTAVPLLVQAAAWAVTPEKRIEFLDASGKTLLAFDRAAAPGTFAASQGGAFTLAAVGGTKEAPRAATVAAALDAKAAAPATPEAVLPPLNPDEVVGTWGMARERFKPLCSIDLLPAKGKKAGTFAAKLSGGCIDIGLKVFSPVAWRTDRGRLILIAAKGHEQSFAPGKDGVFGKDPPSGSELYMRKQ
jgi:hypothetical protein